MNKELIYADDEKVVRKYNVFAAKGAMSNKRGVELIVTNKRVIAKTFQTGVFNNSLSYKEVLIENVSGDIYSSINKKIGLARVALFIFLAFFCFYLNFGTVTIIIGISMIVMVILAFVFPITEGKLEILNKGMAYEGISSSAGKIIKGNKRNTISLLDIVEGSGFSLMQREVGYIISEIKKGTDLDKLTIKQNNNIQPKKVYTSSNYNNNNYYQNNNYQNNNSYQSNDDDEIPLI